MSKPIIQDSLPNKIRTLERQANADNPAQRALSRYATVASAAAIIIPTNAEVISITGTTNITSIGAVEAGRRLTLVFAGALVFTDGANLKLAGNFVTSTDSTITLVSDGTNFYETSRSTN